MNHNAKLLSAVAVLALTMCALGGIVLMSEDSDALTSTGSDLGSAASPLTGLSGSIGGYGSGTYYVEVGSSVNITGENVEDGSEWVTQTITSVTSGYGLSVSTYNYGGYDVKKVSGTISKAGNITIAVSVDESGNDSSKSVSIVAVASEEDIDFTSPAAVSALSGSSVSYTAKTNIPATFSVTGGTLQGDLTVSSSTGKVSGTLPTVTSKSTETLIIKAVSKTNSSNTTTQTIKFTVYPVAKITASSTSVTGTEGEPITSVRLTSNVGMTFSVQSGSFPSGISMTSAGVISGTPTTDYSGSVTVKGVTTEGPSQTKTVTIRFNIEAAEDTLTVSVQEPSGSYMAGQSVSLTVSINVPDCEVSLSGTAAEFLTYSGGKVVGSIPGDISSAQSYTLTVSAESPKGQTASDSVTIEAEPKVQFTTVPTADCIIEPVYENEVSSLVHIDELDAAVADFVFDDTLTIRGTFTGSDATSVTWYWGDGTSSEGFKCTHTYDEAGVYEVRMVASNNVGDSEMTMTVSVSELADDSMFVLVILALLIVLVVLLALIIVRRRKASGGKAF